MHQNLFFIPHAIAGVSVFGVGWLLLIWLVISFGFFVWLYRREGLGAVGAHLFFVALVAFIVAFVFPMLEVRGPDGRPIGLPIRGYGVFVLTGFGLGILLALPRAHRQGISTDTMSSLAMWMFAAGIIGARLFFVVQYWDTQFRGATLQQTLIKIVQVTEGGLVVYGALLAVLPTLLVFCRRYGISPLTLGDVVSPSLVLGLAFGRIGCLMNGCCYGGLCEPGQLSLQFPRYNSTEQHSVSPPYEHQWSMGQLHGFTLGADPKTGAPLVRSVAADSPAAQAGLQAGSQILAINGRRTSELAEARQVLAKSGPEITVQLVEGPAIGWTIGELPERSLPVHPVQIYSSIDAFLLCFLLLMIEPYLSQSGALLAWTLTLYPPVRFVEEIIRVDEPGRFGTGLSISQWVSLALLLAAAGLWGYLYYLDAGRRRSYTESIAA